MAEESVVKEAQERYQEGLDATSEQRRQQGEDLEFSDPSNPTQWDAKEKLQRETDPGGSRPCLVMDQVTQFVSSVVGQIDQSPPALHCVPSGDGADKRVAEQLDGFFRAIEYSSRAKQHYMRALTSAARTGVGYLILRPEYTDRALGYQEPRISSEGDPLRVVLDPWSVELDGSDADWGQLLTPMSYKQFERQFGEKAAKVSFGDEHGRSITDERESIVVAEEWRIENKTENIVVYLDAQGLETSLPEDEFWEAKQRDPSLQPTRTFTDKYACVKWLRMSGAEVLTKEAEYPASGIGIVPVYGYVGWSDGRMHYCGIPRRARSAQQAYNYHISEIRAYMAQAPKAPWIVPARAIRGFENLWDRASVDSRAYLPIHDVDADGSAIAPPQRPNISVNLQNNVAGSQQALHDIQASLGMYQASLGAPSNETSGVAIEGRKQQGEAATSHFPSNLSASVAQIGKLCLEMIPRLIDTPRQLRILGIDHTPGTVRADPGQTEALQETDQGLSINPNVGKYDARVVVGASFSTQRQQAQQAYTEMMRSNPQMMPAIAPLWAQTLDVPHADKLAQVLTAVAPDAVKAILQPDQHDSVGALKAQVDQLQGALKEAIKHAHDAQADADQAHQQLESKATESEDKDDELAIQAYNAQTNRIKVIGTTLDPQGVQALVVQTINQMLSHPDPLPGELQAQAAQQQIPQQPMPEEQPTPEAAPPQPQPEDTGLGQ